MIARAYFAFIAVVLLALSAYAVYGELNTEWKKYQSEYYGILANLEPDVNKAAQISRSPAKIIQIYNVGYHIVDRCTTCHISYADNRFETERQPFKKHSSKILEDHPIEIIGCAVCHDGNGHATSLEAAHGLEKHSEWPLLTGKWIQSRCVRCHTDGNVSGAAILRKGLGLIDKAACFACHNMKESPPRERIAPNLDNIGSKVNPEWLKSWLMGPRTYLKDTLMPNYELNDRKALAITAYLMTLIEESPEPLNAGALIEGEVPPDGERLFKISACQSCHSVRGSAGFEGIVAPDLTHIGDKVKSDWLARWLKNPTHYQPGTTMPAFDFTDREAGVLAGYLVETFNSGKAAESAENSGLAAELKRSGLIDEGETLVKEYGCMSCHAIGGKKSNIKIGTELSDVGDWDEHHLEWGEAQHDGLEGLRDFLSTKLANPRAFGPSTKMPNFKFTDQEIEAIVVALMSFSENPLPMEARIVKSEDVVGTIMPAGEVGDIIDRHQCFTCHSLKGRFGRMAPDLSFEGDKVKKEWLVEYLSTPHLIRPLTEKRMPRFGMNDEEVQKLANFIDVAWKDDRVPGDPFGGNLPSPDLISRGKELFESRYMCIDCHMIGGKGDEVGPALDNIGDRLKPGWMYQWVLDPQLFYENDMPQEEPPEEDAKALTAYLMSLTRKAAGE